MGRVGGAGLSGTTRTAVGLALLLMVAACSEYLTVPGRDAEPEPPVLVGASLSPDSVVILDAEAVVEASVRGRSNVGIDSVGLVLVAPSGTERVRCVAVDPAEGDIFDGGWRCPLTFVPGSESGVWTPDSVGVFGADGTASRVWTGLELATVGLRPHVQVVGTPPVATAVRVDPDLVVLASADTATVLSASVLNQYGGVMAGVPVVWSSADEGVATVSAAGRVVPVGIGNTEIVATAGTLEGRARVEVPVTPVLHVSPTFLVFDDVGGSASLAATVRDQFGGAVTPAPAIVFQSEDPTVAGVDSDGTVRAVRAGSTTIVVVSGDLEFRVAVTVEGGGGQLTPGHRWINPDGGSFTDPRNWDRGVVPSATDTAVIDLEGRYEVRLNAAADVGVLLAGNGAGTARPTLALQDGRLAVRDTAHFGAGSVLHIEFGALEGEGSVVVDDTLRWSGGLQSGPGRTVVTPNGVAVLTGAVKHGDGRALDLQGVGSWDSGKISLRNGAELAVRPGAELRMEAGDTLEWTPASVSGRLRVEGQVVVGSGSGTTVLAVPYVNEGEIWVERGATLRSVNSAAGSGSGDWWIDTDAALDLASTSNMTFGAGGSITGNGVLRVSAGVVSVEGALDLPSGRIEAYGNSLLLRSGGTLEVGTLDQTAGRISFSNGTVLRVGEAWQWGERGLDGEGTLNVAAGAIVTVSTASSFRGVQAGAQLVLDGTLLWSTGQIALRDGGDLHVRSGGRIEITGDVNMSSVNTQGPESEPLFLNEGTVLKSGGTGISVFAADFRNRGVVTLGAGRMLHAGSVWHEPGSVLQGTGVFDLQQADALEFRGLMNPGRLPDVTVGEPTASVLSFVGSLSFGAEHRLALQLAGTGSTDHDRVSINGAFGAGGELRVSGFGDWVPQDGEQLTVMQFTSRSGTFDQVTGLDFGLALGGVALDTVWMADRLMLVGRTDAGGGEPPAVTVVSPADMSVHPEGTPITFTAIATDAEDGDLSSAVEWRSDVDGFLGTGSTVPASLSPGFHSVTAVARDSGGQEGTASVTVIVSTTTSGVLYGVDAGTDALHRIDPEAGTSIRIGTSLGSAATPVGMAVVPATSEVLVWNNSPLFQLLTVDVCTGLGISLQNYSGLDAVQAIAYRADGLLFGFTQEGMFRIDTRAPGRPLTWVNPDIGVRVGGADFTPNNRLYGLELRTGAPIRLVEIDPGSGTIARSMDIRDAEGNLIDIGIAGSLTWNASTGRFLASSTRGYAGVGTAFFDLSLDGIATNPRAYSGSGMQGIGFRPEPNCGG